jgi:hypothetical protein
VKALVLSLLLGVSAVAAADVAKVQPAPRKLDRDARVLGRDARDYVMDKEAPSLDKTVPLARPRTQLKDK